MAPLLFALNGRRVELQDVDPSMTLLEFLRVHARLTGTKLGCGEGGCGACVVVRTRYDPATDTVEEASINSCIALLGSAHLCAVTTIEGLGSSKTRLHAIQSRFLGFHASQCGFCTPGMCMSLYAGLKQLQSCQKSSFPSQTISGSYDSHLLERSIQGNICRCTGYRPIVDACKSFGSDVDIEDLGLNTFWKDRNDARAELLPSYDPSNDPEFPDFLKHEIIQRNQESKVGDDSAAAVVVEEARWVRATSFKHAFGLLKRFQESNATNKMKIVVGNTSAGVYREWDHSFFIDISSIPELHRMEETSDGVEIGAAVTISKLINFLENRDGLRGARIFGAIAKHISKVGTPHVRNAGSIGGNLIMARDFGFDSDIATVLLATGARLTLLVGSPEKEIVQSMDEFLEGGDLGSGSSLLISIRIPIGSEAVEFKTYRASPRPLGNSVAYANAGFLACFSKAPNLGHYRLEDSRLAFGAVGYKHAFRVIQVEEFLRGKIITSAVLLEAIEMLKTVLAPKTETKPKSAYRAALAVSFFFKFFRKKLGAVAGGSGEYDLKDHPRSLICGRQEIPRGERRRALGQPSEKLMANLQVTGEAVYVDDIPCPNDTLHAAFVYSQKAYARIKEISTRSAMACPGAVKFLSVRDIPAGGGNVGIKSDLANESLFAEHIVECVGHAIGLMILQ